MCDLTSFSLETVLVSVQDRCTVCAKRTMDLENCFGRTRWCDKSQVKGHFGQF
jgi:hypothetical protein